MSDEIINLLKYLTNEGRPISPIEDIRVSKGNKKITCILSGLYTNSPKQIYYIEKDDSSVKLTGNKAIDCNIAFAEQVANERRTNIISTSLGRVFGIKSSDEGVLAALIEVYNSENAFQQKIN